MGKVSRPCAPLFQEPYEGVQYPQFNSEYRGCLSREWSRRYWAVARPWLVAAPMAAAIGLLVSLRLRKRHLADSDVESW